MNEKADSESRELAADEIYQAFKKEFLENESPLKLVSYETSKISADEINCTAKIVNHEEEMTITGQGNGPINAFVNASKMPDSKILNSPITANTPLEEAPEQNQPPLFNYNPKWVVWPMVVAFIPVLKRVDYSPRTYQPTICF